MLTDAAPPDDPQRAEPKRDAILDAALRLFAQRGFDGTAVPLIAETAGVATGTIYRYFPGKEALVNALFRRWKAAFLAALRHGFPELSAPRAQFSHVWAAMMRFARDEPTAFLFLEMHFHAPYLDAASLALEDEMMEFIRSFIRRAQAAGALKPVAPDLLIALVFGAFVQLVKHRAACRLDAGAAIDAAAESCLWDAIVAAPLSP